MTEGGSDSLPPEQASPSQTPEMPSTPAAPEAPDTSARPKPPAERRVWPIVVAIAAILIILTGAAFSAWILLGTRAPTPVTAPAVAPGGDPAIASIQAKVVADLVAAWAADDRATIESLVASSALPWTAPAPPLPAGISRELVATLAKPHQEGTAWVVGDPSYAELSATADGGSPEGVVHVRVIVGGGTPRDVSVGVVSEGGGWKVSTVDGLKPADGLARLLQ